MLNILQGFLFVGLIVVLRHTKNFFYLYDGGQYITAGGKRSTRSKPATCGELYRLNSPMYD